MMKLIKTTDAVGHILCHDITQIIPDKVKDAVFRKGHIVRKEDIPVLLSVGKEHLYVWERTEGMLHEDEAAEILLRACLNDNMSHSLPKEGKIELFAETDGVFLIDREKLMEINSLGEMMIASRHGDTPVKKGDKLAGMRVIPLVIEHEKMKPVEKTASPIFRIAEYKRKRFGLIVTGSEVKKGLIDDGFTPVIEAKLAEFGAEVTMRELSGDDTETIRSAIIRMADAGAEGVICTGGMSVDPDDRTPGAIKSTGARIVTYGAPVLPGAMLMLAYLERDGGDIPVMGIPGCAMFSKRTVLDLILPRIIADIPVGRKDIAVMGEGGLCLGCSVCSFPDCGFGKAHG